MYYLGPGIVVGMFLIEIYFCVKAFKIPSSQGNQLRSVLLLMAMYLVIFIAFAMFLNSEALPIIVAGWGFVVIPVFVIIGEIAEWISSPRELEPSPREPISTRLRVVDQYLIPLLVLLGVFFFVVSRHS